MVKWKEIKKGIKLRLIKRPITHPQEGYRPLEIGDIVEVIGKNKSNFWDLTCEKYGDIFGITNDKDWLICWEIACPKTLMDLKM